jgi:signal recognition particle subunit SRP72
MAAKSRDLSAILQQVHLSEPEDVLNAANAALNTSQSDATAHRARIVALLKLERYPDVLKAFDAAGPALRRDAPLEFAYALYKSGENDKAISFIEQEGSKSRALMHVAAQAVRVVGCMEIVWLIKVELPA